MKFSSSSLTTAALFLPAFSSAWVLPNPTVLRPSSSTTATSTAIGLGRGDDSISNEFDIPMFDLPLEFTLSVSSVIYSFADLREIVSDHETTFHPGLTEEEQLEREIVAFDTPALIDTRFSADKRFPSTKMNNPVTAAAIKEFLDRNSGHIRQGFLEDPTFVYDGSNTEPNYMSEVLADMANSFDADIVEFDDMFARERFDTTLVYSVIVNRSSKQIVVVFRGTANAKDIAVDANFRYNSPEILQQITDRDVKLHRGFSQYLVGDTIEEETQLEQIINVLKEVYAYKDGDRDYSDYQLILTGHSLGGALAQLCSYFLAGLPETDFIPKPVQAVTYASPVVGNDQFFESFRDLERDDKLRHLRVSNRRDVIPGTPGMGLTKPYVQTGVNIHLQPKGTATVEYENTKSIISQASFNPLDRHSLYGDGNGYSYYERLYAKERRSGEYVNKNILDKSIEELYDEHARLGLDADKGN